MSRCTVLLLFAFATSPSLGVTIDFETDGDGNPIPIAFPGFDPIEPNEYSAQGLQEISSNVPQNLNRTNPANVGTSIAGNYFNVGAFQGRQTVVELKFSPGITDLSFDWAGSVSGDEVSVDLFGVADVFLGTIGSQSDSNFVNPADFTVFAGSFSGDAGGAEIRRVVVNEDPVGNHAIVLDNLQFTQVPEPDGVIMIVSSFLAALFCRRIRLRRYTV